MDSIIFYQPRQIAVPAFRNKAIRSPTFRYPPVTVSSRQSWVAEQRSEWDKTLKAHDVIEVVHLTGLDQGQGPVLEQRAAGDDPTRVQGNSTAVKDDRVRKGTDGAGGDDDDDDEEFPSIASILSGTKRKGAVAKIDLSSKHTTTEQLADDGGSESDRAGAGAGAGAGASGVRPGDIQDKPIELDDNEPDDHEQHGATSDDGGRSRNATGTGGQPVSSPSLSDPPSEIIAGGPGVHSAPADGVNGDQSPDNENVDRNTVDDEERPRPAERQRDDPPSHNEITEEGPNYDSAGQEAPASAGHIHDVFAEYEKMFGMSRMKQQPQKRKEQSSFSSHHNDSIRNGSLENHLGESVCDEDSKDDSDDGVMSIGSPTEVRSGDLSASRPAGTQPHDGLGPAREGNHREKSAESMSGLEHSSTSTGAFNQDYTALQNAPSRKLEDKFPPSNAGTQRNPPTRKRSRPLIESVAPSADALISKRPSRIRKETWKVREAKEALTSSDSREKKRRLHADPACRKDEEDRRTLDVEDIYLGEDGSIQCVVRWKSSLVAKDNLVGEELHERCEKLFKMKYGAREWEKRLKKDRLTKRRE